ncbi:MAG TPA: adenylate/guanylate cyclase domain-containing protein [Candidatus Limnocylindria bacterium]|nr:adenylate/guanylate cyclase domain-containing protein [Candidatus Limnocylindria bacterium]
MASCPSCHREVAEGFAFCPHCGAAIETSKASGEERKLVTLLFADVTGSTELAEALDAEVVRELMGEYFAVAREEIEARGGTVEKFIGDAVMAVFGVPVAHEDDPTRALRAALAIRARLDELNVQRRGTDAPQLQLRIGVNTGEVVATTSPRPGEGMVTGDAVNVAARIQQLAEPGQIVVGERTAAAAPNFTTRPLGTQRLKGKATETAVVELLSEAASTADRGVPGLRSPLVGRDRELELLVSTYERVASERRPHLVTLYGEPGVGKSRLTIEFLRSLAKREPAPGVLRGRCLSYGSGVTFWPLAEILKAQAGILDSDPPAEAVAKVEALGARVLTSDVTPDPVRTTALLAYTVGMAVSGFEFGRLDPDQLSDEVHGAWRALFSALAAASPIVVVVEDIHWADAALLDLLEDVSERVQGGVLFLCPARPELADRRSGWGGGRRNFSSVALDPLPAEATSELVDHLLTVEELPPELHGRIVERAGGNPFFVEEILRHLIDGGHIVRTGSGWRAESGLAEVVIPDTVQAVLAARIDLLEPAAKRTLQAASVVGRIFWPAPVAQFLNGTAAQLDESLRSLESRDLVLARLASSMAGQPEYIFKHALVRDVAYESIPRRERAEAHLRVADWIEDVIGERRLEVVELLAYHYTEAQRAATWANVEPDRADEIRARAVAVLYEAAWEAVRHGARSRARERADAGLDLAQGPLEQAEGLEIHTSVDLWEDDGDSAWRRAIEAVDLRVAAGPRNAAERLAIARGCALALALPTRWPGIMRSLPSREEAAPYLELGNSLLPDGDSEERVGMLLVQGAWSWGFGEAITDPEAVAADRRAAEEAVAIARRLERPDLLSGALDTTGATGSLLEGYRGVLAPQAERLSLIPKLDNLPEIVDIYGTNAWGLAHVGQFREAIDYGRLGWEIVEAKGVLNYVPGAFMGVAQFRLGEWDQFWDTFRRVDALFAEDRPLRYHALRIYAVAAYVSEVTGDAAGADGYLERLERSQEAQGTVGVSGPRSWVVGVLIRRGQFAVARARLEVIDPVRDLQNRDLTYEAWADLIAAEGTWDEAAHVIQLARDWAEETGLRFLPAIADRLEGQAALAGGDPESAMASLERSRVSLVELEAAWDRARTELPLARALRAVGRGREAVEVARAALTTFQSLGAVVEIAEAESVLAETAGATA